MTAKLQTAYFGGGCFWCTEATFKEVKGVVSVVPGYAGGTMYKPKYEDVSGGSTGHAEIIKIEFDPQVISYHQLLEIFFATHDPTTLNCQGNDVGTQYRSVILYDSEDQKNNAEGFIGKLTKDKVFAKPIVTEIKKMDKFFEAEKYHHDYYAQNKVAPYCLFTINPKLSKFRKKFKNILK
ncbi:MAG: peptide-methionine (S)-S-oxide reductase MsrA [Candidatus Parcubacteria bacterium]|nr:peptide-methionine (S)-S-oxide reductase MsrA [Candidatus Parcubacteria bacterium]